MIKFRDEEERDRWFKLMENFAADEALEIEAAAKLADRILLAARERRVEQLQFKTIRITLGDRPVHYITHEARHTQGWLIALVGADVDDVPIPGLQAVNHDRETARADLTKSLEGWAGVYVKRTAEAAAKKKADGGNLN